MVYQIERLKQVAKIPAWQVIFFKDSGPFNFQGDHSYSIGLVIPRNLPNALVVSVQETLYKKAREAYSLIVPEIERYTGSKTGSKLPEGFGPGSFKRLNSNDMMRDIRDKSDSLPKGKDILFACAGTPEDCNLVRKFASKLEELLAH